jgi:hypothetical protein
MPIRTLGPYRSAAAFLGGLGVFCVIYPLLVKVFAPQRVFSGRHVAFFVAGVVCLAAAGLLGRSGRARG